MCRRGRSARTERPPTLWVATRPRRFESSPLRHRSRRVSSDETVLLSAPSPTRRRLVRPTGSPAPVEHGPRAGSRPCRSCCIEWPSRRHARSFGRSRIREGPPSSSWLRITKRVPAPAHHDAVPRRLHDDRRQRRRPPVARPGRRRVRAGGTAGARVRRSRRSGSGPTRARPNECPAKPTDSVPAERASRSTQPRVGFTRRHRMRTYKRLVDE